MRHPHWVYLKVNSDNRPTGQHIPFQQHHIMKIYIMYYLVFLIEIHRHMFCIWLLKSNLYNEHHVTQHITWNCHIKCHFVIDLALICWTFLTYFATNGFLKLILYTAISVWMTTFRIYSPCVFSWIFNQSLSQIHLQFKLHILLLIRKRSVYQLLYFQHYLQNGGVFVLVCIF